MSLNMTNDSQRMDRAPFRMDYGRPKVLYALTFLLLIHGVPSPFQYGLVCVGTGHDTHHPPSAAQITTCISPLERKFFLVLLYLFLYSSKKFLSPFVPHLFVILRRINLHNFFNNSYNKELFTFSTMFSTSLFPSDFKCFLSFLLSLSDPAIISSLFRESPCLVYIILKIKKETPAILWNSRGFFFNRVPL